LHIKQLARAGICAKKSRPLRRPEFREETPKEAYAASLLHCDNRANQNLFTEKGGSGDPPFSFCLDLLPDRRLPRTTADRLARLAGLFQNP
jgi:hypothetical protein